MTAVLLALAMSTVVASVAVVVVDRHDRELARRRTRQVEQLHRIAELATVASDASSIWPSVRDTLCDELRLGRCWFEPEGHVGFPFPELGHDGMLGGDTRRRWIPGGFELPVDGVGLAVIAQGRRLGRLVMLPDPGHGLTIVDRRVAVAVADQFGMVAARTPDLGPLW